MTGGIQHGSPGGSAGEDATGRPGQHTGCAGSERETLCEARCGVDMPPAGDGAYCPCVLRPGHEGPHEYKRGPHATQGFAWPQGSNDSGSIWRVKE